MDGPLQAALRAGETRPIMLENKQECDVAPPTPPLQKRLN
jgi:hypothetical protein